jgi:LmbE family N-acetylglucosaminyl deacetylase
MEKRYVRRVLAIAPHPDDELLGCGGSLARRVHQGAIISIIYMTSGEAAEGYYGRKRLDRVREREARAGAHYLGINDLYFLRLRDGALPNNPESADQLAALLRQIKPEIVYTPHAHDDHPDHKACHALTIAAIKRAGDSRLTGQPWKVRILLAYEIWSPLAEYNHIVDITPYMSLKINALRCHQSQVQVIAYDQGIIGLNRYRGVTSGKGTYCECFAKTVFKNG